MSADYQAGAIGRRIVRKLQAIVHQVLGRYEPGFIGVVEGYLDPIETEAGTTERGVLTGRVVVRPKHRRYDHRGMSVVLPKQIAVPVSGYKHGPFLTRPAPFAKGDEVWVDCSWVEIENLIADDEYRQPSDNVDVPTLDNAVVQPGGLRMTSDPKTPNEALDADYYAVVDSDNNPIGKIVVTPDAECHVYLKKLVLHAGEIHLGKESAVNATGAKNCKSGVCSPVVFLGEDSDYEEGLTEPEFYGSPAEYQGKSGEEVATREDRRGIE